MQTVHVFDTWVTTPEHTLHFDVMTADLATALKLATAYVAATGHTSVSITAEECRFCHAEPLVVFSEQQQREFREAGGFIVPLSA